MLIQLFLPEIISTSIILQFFFFLSILVAHPQYVSIVYLVTIEMKTLLRAIFDLPAAGTVVSFFSKHLINAHWVTHEAESDV